MPSIKKETPVENESKRIRGAINRELPAFLRKSLEKKDKKENSEKSEKLE